MTGIFSSANCGWTIGRFCPGGLLDSFCGYLCLSEMAGVDGGVILTSAVGGPDETTEVACCTRKSCDGSICEGDAETKSEIGDGDCRGAGICSMGGGE